MQAPGNKSEKQSKLIETKDLFFSYRSEDLQVPIIQGVDLIIYCGQLTALSGPSGSGKSTLLYLLSGMLKADSGDVYFKNQNIKNLSSSALAELRNEEIGFIFQQFHLLPKLTVLENILLPGLYSRGKSQGQLQQRAIELAKKVGLGERLDHLPRQLSGGQQQRVAIARALLMNPSLILADEPTGSLDTQNSNEIMTLFQSLVSEGTTIVLITHDKELAQQCDRELHFRDGKISAETQHKCMSKQTTFAEAPTRELAEENECSGFLKTNYIYIKNLLSNLLSLDIFRSSQSRGRTILTMIGVVVGVAAVMIMLTMGRFAKDQILDSYAELGVQTVSFSGYGNWRLRPSEKVPAMFRELNWEKDLEPLDKIFPFIQAISPVLDTQASAASYGGQTLNEEVPLFGVNEWALPIIGRRVIYGNSLSYFHVQNRSSVCVVGIEIVKKLFRNRDPLGEYLNFTMNETGAGCQIIGVLESRSSAKSRKDPNMEVYFPYTTLQSMITSPWARRIQLAYIKVHKDAPIEGFAKILPQFFEQKYGKSGIFNVSSESQLISQMQKFLSIFTWLLASIAMVTLTVGGMGITNMMLVSVNERLREIGIRKSFGATDKEIRRQFLQESITICAAAGVIGLIFGFVFYQSALWFASQISNKISFQWIFDPLAFAISLLSIFLVGVFSGLFPAMRAEKLQVIEALRSE